MRSLLLACLCEVGCVQVLGATEPEVGGSPTPIQLIMGPSSDADHVEVGTPVSVNGVFVTGASESHSTLFVQAPDGDTAAGHTYPEFSATRVFVPVLDFEFPSIGDCVDIVGTVAVFAGATQVSATALSLAEDCGTPPAPFVVPSTNPPVTFADLQSQVTPTGGSAPGPKTAQFEDVLISFQNVQIVTSPDPNENESFHFAPQGTTSPVVTTSNFLISPPATLAVGTSLRAITGVYPAVSGNRILNPRTTGDYVP